MARPAIDIAMQVRCLYCRREQYAPAVWAISHGTHPCVWCGKTPPVLTPKEYEKELRKSYDQADYKGSI